MMDKKRLTLATSAEDSKDVELHIDEKAQGRTPAKVLFGPTYASKKGMGVSTSTGH